MDTYDKSVTNVSNLAYWASHEASLPHTAKTTESRGIPMWVKATVDNTTAREFTPGHNGDKPKPLDLGAGIVIKPVYFCVTGWVGTDKKTEFYSVNNYGADSARMSFQQLYYTAGVRGVTVIPLYDLDRRV
jgi:hypothetical protein